MKYIALRARKRRADGSVALRYVAVDDADYILIKNAGVKLFLAAGYPALHLDRSGCPIRLHRWLLGLCDAPHTVVVDHRNGNKLDCTRENLRICTQAENARNRRKPKNATTEYIGVTRIENKYVARYRTGSTRYARSLGSYDTPEQAARAWDAFAETREGLGITKNFADNRPTLVRPKWIEEAEIGDLFEFDGDIPIAVRVIHHLNNPTR